MTEHHADDSRHISSAQPAAEWLQPQPSRLRILSTFSRWLAFWRRFRRNRAAVVGLFLATAFVIVGIVAPIIAPFDPLSTHTGEPFSLPNAENYMGTDDLGRDIFSGVVYGIRFSMLVGVLAATTSALIGTTIGAISGYFGGWLDDILMRLTELFLIIPKLFLALVIVALFGTSLWIIILVIGLLSWPPIARVVRAEFLALREQEFVEAAHALGASDLDIAFSEILPNTSHVILIAASLQIPAAILLEAGLSFLGLGDPLTRSLGLMLNDAFSLLRRAWWTAVFPGLAISLISLGFNMTGDGLNDALNPRLKDQGA